MNHGHQKETNGWNEESWTRLLPICSWASLQLFVSLKDQFDQIPITQKRSGGESEWCWCWSGWRLILLRQDLPLIGKSHFDGCKEKNEMEMIQWWSAHCVVFLHQEKVFFHTPSTPNLMRKRFDMPIGSKSHKETKKKRYSNGRKPDRI